MLKIVKKDILISRKNLLLVSAYIVLVPVLFYLTKDDKQMYLPFYTSLFPIAFFLNRNCYQEDNVNIRQFIRTLGVSQKKFMLAKYLITLAIIVFATATTAIEQQLLYGSFSPFILSIAFFVTAMYAGVFLFLFYVFDYSYSQFTLYVIMGVLLIGIALSKFNSSLFSDLYVQLDQLHPAIIFALSLVLYSLIFFISTVNKILYSYHANKG
ncbi:ABC-2 transporter permease [Trichococcus pasteurii]|uniref:ABC-2 transporter permease n=1 Tax=Trichococcus pasteurii TaxID=43064 RepID=A0A1W1IGY1_9LACT|nr:ABC-2 transporter permease [Trichococcus pasteurii]SFE90165.1 ABC-2 family transporter protein [Trichococcus pasteurii]SLM52277.1 Hypothetical protein TPAS_1971 [Trichococcus pasteurii]SSB93158.1 Hypothetical protein TPAS_1971 [Trichococcus pasteurii]